MYSVRLFLTLSALSIGECTIDVNFPELQYLSDHLTEEECHKLVASLHFQVFEFPQQVAAAERRLPEDVPCLDLLLHWNSQAGEGKGSTHVEIGHRLKQIGRNDLANWLARTVFHELSENLERNVYCRLGQETTRPPRKLPDSGHDIMTDEVPWLGVDSIMAILLLVASVVFILGCFYVLFLLLEKFRNSSKFKEIAEGFNEMQEVRRELKRQLKSRRARPQTYQDSSEETEEECGYHTDDDIIRKFLPKKEKDSHK
ncbi:UNVERIFIED_CONTAM: hypothetical protein PYX00_001074 [Menopon gallinae]|uniref:Uncharacterized protein n=1 Tax=Menopon gallinae TaxID=328185 RepID=A0AAW2IBJ0_9NEOP